MQSKYDPFFSRSLEHKPIAQAFFKQHLPKHISPSVDFDTLRRVDRTSTNEKLEKRYKDMAYEAQMEGKQRILACAEHQSRPDRMMLVRLLHYSADSLAPYFEAEEEIPIVVNVMLYHGEVAPYPYHNTLKAYYGHPQWGSDELNARFYIVDCTHISDEEFLQHGHCAPMALLLKHSSTGNFELETAAYRQVFQSCIDAVGDGYIFTMLMYAIELSNAEAGEKIFNFIEKVLINKKDIIMTYAQVLENRGEAKERLNIAKTMLQQLHLAPEVVEKATGLTQEEIAKLAR